MVHSLLIFRYLKVSVWVAALILAMAPPMLYLQLSLGRVIAEMERDVQFEVERISNVISRTPELWHFQTVRIHEMLSRSPANDAGEVRIVTDADNQIVSVFTNTADGVVPQPALERSSPLLDSGRAVGRLEFRRSYRPLAIRTAVVAIVCMGFWGTIAVVVQRYPVKSLEKAWSRVNYLATYDTLTNLSNRTAFIDCLAATIDVAKHHNCSLAVLCLDLNRFKEVNDSFGHDAGDLLLKEVAARLRACIRDDDTLARLSGDEFAIIQLNVRQPDNAVQLAHRIISVIAQPYDIKKQDVLISTSIGIALYDKESSRKPDDLLKCADLALYDAKAKGRGSYSFYEELMHEELAFKKKIKEALEVAITHSQLSVHYQPQVDIGSEKTVGAEALLRWEHPELGYVAPDQFIPIAEQNGLIVDLGRWVLRRACLDAVKWPDLTIAVNLSPVQFRHGCLVETIKDILEETALPPQRLELEITEGLLLNDTEDVLIKMKQLKSLGVRFALDDFGTGYCSLSYLQRFTVDKIKIDKYFTHKVLYSNEALTIVRATINLGRSLSIRTNVEGVETQEQLAVLRREGFDEAQGYYFGRPMPVSEFEDFYYSQRSSSAA